LTDVYVEPDYRRRGIAQAMVQAAIEMLEEAGADYIYTDVMSDNEGMLELVDQLGFERRLIRLRRELGR
jgi:ribosomal protein S18 acetylase RimI-like enzyme